MSETRRPMRTRFAPSPTGFLHIGSMRTVLFDWLLAKQSGGQFLLRIEDTDRKRYVPEAEQQVKESMLMMDFQWDEGPDVGGPHEPYHESERLTIYHRYAAQLEEQGVLYRCYCTPERLDAVRQAQMARKEPPGYDRHCRYLSPEERTAKQAEELPSVFRLAMPLEGETVLHDALRGPISFPNAAQKDQVMIKSDGFPTYHFASTIDDHLMEITHVLRGDEWIATSPLHVTLYQALGWEQPVFVHVPQVLGPDGKKLSKRHGATAINEFIEEGYLVEALTNTLALVGWGYDETTELMTREELIERFSIDHISPNGGVFSHDKLRWFNGQYIRRLSVEDLANRIMPYLEKANMVGAPATEVERFRITQLVPLIHDRLVILSEAPDLLQFFFRAPQDYNLNDLVPKKLDAAKTEQLLRVSISALDGIYDWTEEQLETTLRQLAEEMEVKTGDLFMAIRVAVTGSKATPPLFQTLHALGKDETIRRLDFAASTLTSEQ